MDELYIKHKPHIVYQSFLGSLQTVENPPRKDDVENERTSSVAAAHPLVEPEEGNK